VRFPDAVCSLSKNLCRIATAANQVAAGVSILQRLLIVLARSRTDGATVTPVHADWARLAVAGSAHAAAARVLDTPLFEVAHAAEWGTRAADVLQYHYCGGCLYADAGAWAKAAEFFRTVGGARGRRRAVRRLWRRGGGGTGAPSAPQS